jgi:hypothetical protein
MGTDRQRFDECMEAIYQARTGKANPTGAF